jgi:8-amino-3,8-dideoxy-alpha-D-manno-octulosonate transaminase
MPGYEWIDKRESKAVKQIFTEGGTLMAHGFSNQRKKYHVRNFEKNIKKKFKTPFCTAVSSGTAAIKIALKACGIKPGDEVITQSFNFIATIEAILDCGAKPIIANIDKSLNMDPEEIPKLITKKTKAIIPVHMLGTPCDMKKIKRYTKKFNLFLVEDNCEAVGGKYEKKYLGTIGDVGIFSFDHGKILTTGEGGMLLTRNKKIAKFCNEYHDHGHENNKRFSRGKDTRKIYGFNYRMTEIQGAIGSVQLKKLNNIIKDNKLKYQNLEKMIKPYFELRKINSGSEIIYDTLILIENNSLKRKKIIKILNSLGFGTKNLPDAMEWHCSFYWDHALSKKEITKSKPSYDILSSCVAIPIVKKKNINEYKFLANKLIKL